MKRHSKLLVFTVTTAAVFLLHHTSIGSGLAYQEFLHFMHAQADSLAAFWEQIVRYFASSECRPINHYIFFLIANKFFGGSPAALRVLWLLAHSLNGLLLFVLVRRLTASEGVALFATFVFLTRMATQASFYALPNSAPKLFFFLMLTVIFYLKAEENKGLYLTLSIASYLLAMLTRETFIFLPAALLAYEVIYRPRSEPLGTSIKKRAVKIMPYLAVVVFYLLLRLPFFLAKTNLPAQRSGGVKISYQTLSFKNFIFNALNFVRFNFNILTNSLGDIRPGHWPLLLDPVLFAGLLSGAYCACFLLTKSAFPPIFSKYKKHFLWGAVWFFLFTGLYCFFNSMNMDHIYIALAGSGLIAGCLGEGLYSLLREKKPGLCRPLLLISAMVFLGAFYFSSQRKLKEDPYLQGWMIAGNYMESALRFYPSVTPPAAIHLYGAEVLRRASWYGSLFHYIYGNEEIEVLYHYPELERDKLKRGDIIFRVENFQLYDDTARYLPGDGG